MKSGSGDVQSSAGADILFFSDSGLTTQIPSQIIYYDNVNGIGWFRVLISTLSSSTNGTIYMAVGNASPPGRTSGVWDAHTVAMWPMSNGTAVSGTDVAGANNVTNYGTVLATGQVDGAAKNSTGSAQLSGSDASLVLGSSPRTISGWVNIANFNGTLAGVLEYGTMSTGEYTRIWLDSGNLYFAGWSADMSASYSWSLGTWYHIAYQWDGTNGRLYVNGTLIGGPTAQSLNTVSSGDIYFTFYGAYISINALRMSSVARGADWIKAEYNNEKAPGNIGAPGFWTWGTRTISSGSIMVATTLNWTDERGNAQSYPVNASGVGVPGWAGYCVSLRTDGVHDLTITTSVSGAGTYDCSVAVSRLL